MPRSLQTREKLRCKQMKAVMQVQLDTLLAAAISTDQQSTERIRLFACSGDAYRLPVVQGIHRSCDLSQQQA